MTLDQFVTKYNGKGIDFDGHFGDQCVDLIRQYIHEVWGTQQPYSVTGAYQLLDELPVGYEFHLSGEIKAGDILVWNKGYGENGHTAVAIQSNAQQVQVFEQNNPKGSNCHTAWHNYGSLRGWFRPKAALSKTFMAITTVANNLDWNIPLDALKQKFITLSDNKFEPVFNSKQSSFQDIPFERVDGQTSDSVQVNWYRINVTPQANGQATLFLVNQNQWKGAGSFGTCTWGDPNKPVRIEVECSNIDYFVLWAEHEIFHALQFLTGQPDRTHELLTNDEHNRDKELMDYIDQKKLQEALVKIKT